MSKDLSLNIYNVIKKINETHEIETYLGNKGYSIKKLNLSNNLITNIKKELTIKPFNINSYNDVSSYPIYLESDNKLYVPRFWGINYFGIPNSIKIDVDGLEYLVIDGGKKVLSSKKVKEILVEINEKNIKSKKKIFRKLINYKFKFVDKFKCNINDKKSFEYNYLFKKI